MPWKESDVLEQKVQFVLDYEAGLWTMTELCERDGISRPTGYELMRRFHEGGIAALEERSRAPLHHPNASDEEIMQIVLALRRAHPRWGPKKLRGHLERKYSQRKWPAASTIGDRLKAEGLVVPRRKRHKTPPYTQPFVSLDGPNQVWCADFKGCFHARNGERIDPLTMTDAYSRYLLRCQIVDRMNTDQVQAVYVSAFREYGMPLAIRSDNGAPFASRAIAGLSRLAVFLMKLDIVPERIEPGHPEQNGRHERMHRTLKEETARPAQATRRAQQRAFDQFRQQYNEDRPHEALDQQTPASHYLASPREFPARLSIPEYEPGMQVRSVFPHGDFRWEGDRVFLSETLAGERIGLQFLDEDHWTIYFARFPIAILDSRKRRVGSLSRLEAAKLMVQRKGELPPSPAPHPQQLTPSSG